MEATACDPGRSWGIPRRRPAARRAALTPRRTVTGPASRGRAGAHRSRTLAAPAGRSVPGISESRKRSSNVALHIGRIIALTTGAVALLGCAEESTSPRLWCESICINEVRGSGQVSVPVGVQSVRVQLCFEGDCQETSLPLVPTSDAACASECDADAEPDSCPCVAADVDECVCVDSEDPSSCYCRVSCLTGSTGGVACTPKTPFAGQWTFTAVWYHNTAERPSDGNEYVLRLVAIESGATLLEVTRAIEYVDDFPRTCAECWHGSFFFD